MRATPAAARNATRRVLAVEPRAARRSGVLGRGRGPPSSPRRRGIRVRRDPASAGARRHAPSTRRVLPRDARTPRSARSRTRRSRRPPRRAAASRPWRGTPCGGARLPARLAPPAAGPVHGAHGRPTGHRPAATRGFRHVPRPRSPRRRRPRDPRRVARPDAALRPGCVATLPRSTSRAPHRPGRYDARVVPTGPASRARAERSRRATPTDCGPRRRRCEAPRSRRRARSRRS